MQATCLYYAIKLRNSKNISGFKVGTYTNLIYLYADDITIYLLRQNDLRQTENNIRNTLKILKTSKHSGTVNKVAKVDTMIPEKLRGMGMVNITKFWQSLQLTWLKKLTTSNTFWVKILETELHKIGFHINHLFYGSSTELIHISRNLINPYWKEILKTTATATEMHP